MLIVYLILSIIGLGFAIIGLAVSIDNKRKDK